MRPPPLSQITRGREFQAVVISNSKEGERRIYMSSWVVSLSLWPAPSYTRRQVQGKVLFIGDDNHHNFSQVWFGMERCPGSSGGVPLPSWHWPCPQAAWQDGT